MMVILTGEEKSKKGEPNETFSLPRYRNERYSGVIAF